MATKKKSVKRVAKAKKSLKKEAKTKTVAATKKVTKKAVKKPVKKVAKKAVKAVAKKSVKKVAKKVTRKVAKKAVKTVEKKALPKLALAKKMYTKSELYRAIGAHVGITKRQVAEVFDMLGEVVHSHLKSGAVGVLKLEGLLKIEKIRKPAKKERKGVNPFTGETMVFKAKPAHNIIKVRALKRLKEMAK